MANERQRPDPSGFEAENEIDLVLANAYPNPNREGCPPRDLLITLARRERPIEDPAYKHLFECSPCYREVRALQQAAGERREGFEPPPLRWKPAPVAAAAAAAILIVAAVIWFVVGRPDGTPPAFPDLQAINAQLDLRKHVVMRGEQQADAPALALPRGRLNLTLLLPDGSEPGDYEIQILDSNLTSRASATGRAEMRDFATVLQTTLNTGALAPGTYELAYRQPDADWRLLPLQVK